MSYFAWSMVMAALGLQTYYRKNDYLATTADEAYQRATERKRLTGGNSISLVSYSSRLSLHETYNKTIFVTTTLVFSCATALYAFKECFEELNKSAKSSGTFLSPAEIILTSIPANIGLLAMYLNVIQFVNYQVKERKDAYTIVNIHDEIPNEDERRLQLGGGAAPRAVLFQRAFDQGAAPQPARIPPRPPT